MPKFLVTALVLLLPAVALAGPKDLGSRFDRYAEILTDLGAKVPTSEWKQARCVTVLALAKGGFIVGGQGGSGAVTCRGAGGGAWSAPLLLKAGGTTVGAQIGGQKTDVLMVWKNVDDIDAVVQATGVLQGSAQASAGNSGIGVGGGSNLGAGAGVYLVTQGEGLYAGATFEGLAVSPDKANDDLYGKGTSHKAVLVQRKIEAPAASRPFLDALRRVAK